MIICEQMGTYGYIFVVTRFWELSSLTQFWRQPLLNRWVNKGGQLLKLVNNANIGVEKLSEQWYNNFMTSLLMVGWLW